MILPMLLLAVLFALLFAVNFGRGFAVMFALAALVVAPLYCGYIGWILFSRAGRQRYESSSRAMAAARDNPHALAARLHRRR